jgi:misacylated tRNA(Ala) deacylase
MTTETLFLSDAYLKSATATVTALTEEGGIVLDRTIFYARGGGQPGDSGTLDWDGGRLPIATAVKFPRNPYILSEAAAGLVCVRQARS